MAVVVVVEVAVATKSRRHAGSASQRATRPRTALTGLALAADCGERRVNAHLEMSVCMNTRPLDRVRLTAAVALERRGCLANQHG